MRGDRTQKVLQLVYDLFCNNGGTWPTLGDLQRTLNRQRSSEDAALIVRSIPATLLKPLRSTDGYPAPSEMIILTAEGIERCKGSAEDIDNLVIAVKWLARLVERSDSNDYAKSGMRFTAQQLAEAVALSLESDRNSMSRLVAILMAEGWVRDDGT